MYQERSSLVEVAVVEYLRRQHWIEYRAISAITRSLPRETRIHLGYLRSLVRSAADRVGSTTNLLDSVGKIGIYFQRTNQSNTYNSSNIVLSLWSDCRYLSGTLPSALVVRYLRAD